LEFFSEKELTLYDWLESFVGYVTSSVFGVLAILSFYIWPAVIYFCTNSWLKTAAALGVEILLFALFLIALSQFLSWLKHR
jgi:hypothetical protein